MANKNSCIIHPKSTSGQPSQLFSNLRKEFDYDQSWELWNIAVSPEYKQRYGTTTTYDEFGEPEIQSVLTNLNIWSDNSNLIKKYEQELNTNLPNDNQTLVQRVIDFNKKHEAVKAKIESFNLINTNENTAKIIVEPCTESVRRQAEALETNANTYFKINSYLNNLGFSIDFFSDEFFNGERALMVPNSSVKSAKGLINVIRLSNNQESLEELPEELGHFLIECSNNKSLINSAERILSNNNDLIQEILGSDYEDVVNYYIGRGTPDLVLREALGRLLIRSINNNIDTITSAQQWSLFERLKERLKSIWNNIKLLFKSRTNQKNHSITELETLLQPVLHTFSVSESKKAEIKERFRQYGSQMAHVDTLLQNYRDLFASDGIIQQIRQTIARETAYYNKTYRDIIELRNELDITSEASKLFIKTREDSINNEPKNYDTTSVYSTLKSKGEHTEQQILDIRNLYHFGNYIEKIQELIRSQLSLLQKVQLTSSSYSDVLKHSREINTIRSFVETQEPIIDDLLNFSIAISTSADDEITSTMKAVSEELKKLANEASVSIRSLHSELHSSMNIITEEFWKNSVDQEVLDNIIPNYIQHKENLVDNSKKINYILNFSIGDINGISRLFTAYYAQKDPLINIVNNTLRKQEEKARIASQLFIKEIAEITQEYINKTGSKDTSFIYEEDSKGRPTGFLKTLEGVSISKYREVRKRIFNEIDADTNLTKKQKYEKRQAFKNNSTNSKELLNFEYDHETNSFVQLQSKYGIRVPTTNTDICKEAAEWTTNDFSKLNDAQQEFLIKYLQAKNKLESMLPTSVRCKDEGLYYRAVQRVVASAGEAILNNKTGFFHQLGGLLSNSLYKLDEDDITDYEGYDENINEDTFFAGISKKGKETKNKIRNAIHHWLYPDEDPITNPPDPNNPKSDAKIITKKTSSEFNQRRKVPIYFTRLLSPERLSNLSTDATGSLIEYTMACFRFNAMNEVADIMELTYERAKYRRIQKTKFGRNYLLNLIDPDNSNNALNQSITQDAAGSNMLKSLRQLLDTKLYSEYNMDARGEAGSFSPAKTTNNILKLTAFSMLGYNVFSGINNIVIGKYQTMIEAIGGNNFTKKDWAWAEKEFSKLLPEYLKELGKPYKTSKLALLDEMFNATMEWKETIEGAKYYSNEALRTLSKFNSGVFMNMGETSLKLVAMLATLHHYEMKDANGNKTNLYESLDFIYRKDSNGNKISGTVKVKKNYKKPDGTEFTTKDIIDICLKMNVMNHRMHGIYNREDQVEALRHWWGKLILLFRRFIVPTVENRYMGTRYNVDTKQWEEGFYITGLKYLAKVIFNEIEPAFGENRFKAALNEMNDYQRRNLSKFISEFLTLIFLMFILALLPDYKDENRFSLRAANFEIRRWIQEIEFYQPWNINSIYDILQSPSATLGLLTRWFKVIGSIPSITERYEQGKNKGDLKIVHYITKALPLYPQIRDLIKFAEDDTRFQIFEPVMFERIKNNMDK